MPPPVNATWCADYSSWVTARALPTYNSQRTTHLGLTLSVGLRSGRGQSVSLGAYTATEKHGNCCTDAVSWLEVRSGLLQACNHPIHELR